METNNQEMKNTNSNKQNIQCNEPELKKCIFFNLSNDAQEEVKMVYKSCFNTSLKKAFPFFRDIIYTISLNSKIVGFGMIHNSSPAKHFQIEYPYLYNFCVDPKYRKYNIDGIDKRLSVILLNYIKENEKNLNLDAEKTDIKIVKFWLSQSFKLLKQCVSPRFICLVYEAKAS